MEISDDDQKLFLDWNDIEAAISSFAADGTFDSDTVIIGLTRGGLVPAVMLSHATGCNMKALAYSSKNGKGDNKQPNEPFPVELFDQYSRICIIDEICDSGHTLIDLIEEIKWKHHHNTTVGGLPKIETMAIVYKEQPITFKPTFSYITVQPDCHHMWVVFPWEKNDYIIPKE